MIRAAVGLALVLLSTGCDEEGRETPAPSLRGTPDQKLAIRIAYSEVQTMIFCAGLPAGGTETAAVEDRLSGLRRLAQQHGVGPLVARTQQQWLDSMATADTACPPDAEARIEAEIAELEDLIQALPEE